MDKNCSLEVIKTSLGMMQDFLKQYFCFVESVITKANLFYLELLLILSYWTIAPVLFKFDF